MRRRRRNSGGVQGCVGELLAGCEGFDTYMPLDSWKLETKEERCKTQKLTKKIHNVGSTQLKPIGVLARPI